MTRNEEIEQASKQGSIECFGYEEGDYTIPFKHGAEWADKTMIEKVVKWLEEHLSDEDEMHIFRDKEDTWVYCDLSVLINDLKKAVSNGGIK